MPTDYTQERYATYPEGEATWDVQGQISGIEKGILPVVWNAEDV